MLLGRRGVNNSNWSYRYMCIFALLQFFPYASFPAWVKLDPSIGAKSAYTDQIGTPLEMSDADGRSVWQAQRRRHLMPTFFC